MSKFYCFIGNFIINVDDIQTINKSSLTMRNDKRIEGTEEEIEDLVRYLSSNDLILNSGSLKLEKKG